MNSSNESEKSSSQPCPVMYNPSTGELFYRFLGWEGGTFISEDRVIATFATITDCEVDSFEEFQ